jgi:hypothetical protein
MNYCILTAFLRPVGVSAPGMPCMGMRHGRHREDRRGKPDGVWLLRDI